MALLLTMVTSITLHQQIHNKQAAKILSVNDRV